MSNFLRIEEQALKRIYTEYLTNWQESARDIDKVHPSEVSLEDFCPRRWVLRVLNPELAVQRVPSGLRLTFEIGNYLHDMVQNTLADIGMLWGDYMCPKCGYMMHKTFKPSACLRCNFKGENYARTSRFIYKEVVVEDLELNIKGRCDGLLFIEGKKYVFEFKTIKDNGNFYVSLPYESHLLQMRLYAYCIQKETEYYQGLQEEASSISERFGISYHIPKEVLQNIDGTILWYLNKNTGGIREFKTVFNKQANTHYVNEEIRPKVLPILKWASNGEIPLETCQRKTTCPAFEICKSLKEGEE